MPSGWDLSWVRRARSSCLANACWLCGHLCVSSAYPPHLPPFGIGVPCLSPSFPVPWASLRALSPLAFKSSRISGSVLCSSLAFGLLVSVCLPFLFLFLVFPLELITPPRHTLVSLGLCCYPPDPLVSPRFSFPVVITKSLSPSHPLPRLLCPLPVTCLSPSSASFSGDGLLTDSLFGKAGMAAMEKPHG